MLGGTVSTLPCPVLISPGCPQQHMGPRAMIQAWCQAPLLLWGITNGVICLHKFKSPNILFNYENVLECAFVAILQFVYIICRSAEKESKCMRIFIMLTYINIFGWVFWLGNRCINKPNEHIHSPERSDRCLVWNKPSCCDQARLHLHCSKTNRTLSSKEVCWCGCVGPSTHSKFSFQKLSQRAHFPQIIQKLF